MADIDWSVGENAGVQGNTEANADHIGLYFAAFLRFDITWNAIFRDDRLNFITVDNLNAKFLGDVVDHFTSLEVKAIAKPVRAAHEPGRVEFANRETIA